MSIGRFMIIRIISSRSRLSPRGAYYSTFKSRNDEEKNKSLLENLKNISLSGGKEIVSPPKTKDSPFTRNVTLEILEKVTRYWYSDALFYNSSILSRTFNIPEEHLKNIVWYVRPMMYYTHKGLDETKKIHKTSLVIDVHRLKYDKKYLVEAQKLTFLQDSDEPPKLNSQNKAVVTM